MPRRIQEDHKHFREVVEGTTRKELKKYIKTGGIIRQRGKNGKISIPIPRIDLPRFVYGRPTEGIGRGPGKDGDVVGKDKGKGQGQGGDQAGIDPADAIEVAIDLKDILKMLQDEWELPNMQPKQSQTFEEVKIKYNSLSRVGPKSLLHKTKTLRQTLKRMSAMGQLDPSNAIIMPGYSQPVVPLTPIGEDMRFRQWNEIKIPTSNAIIFFARDISGSMGDFKCEVVSDMTWWIDLWIRQFYTKTERVYVAHDTRAWEVDEQKFYKIRHGGGTVCSSAMQHIAEQLKHRYPPETWNIYVFYFTDGDNWGDDNAKFVKIIKDDLEPTINGKVNLVGITQVLPSGRDGVKEYVDKALANKVLDANFVRTAGISRPKEEKMSSMGWWYFDEKMDEDVRNEAIRNAIRHLLAGSAQTVGGANAA